VGTEKRERQKANRALKQQEAVRQQSRRKVTRWILIAVGAVAGVFLLAWIAGTVVGDDEDPVTPVDTVVDTVVEPVTTTDPASVPATVPTTEG
jgi:ferric-dicitrate binding protein FerR (iron transport regulator)